MCGVGAFAYSLLTGTQIIPGVQLPGIATPIPYVATTSTPTARPSAMATATPTGAAVGTPIPTNVAVASPTVTATPAAANATVVYPSATDFRSGTVTAGTTKTIKLFAINLQPASSTQLRLKVSSLIEITGYTQPSTTTWSGATIGTGCSVLFSKTQLCVDLKKVSGTINAGESLGEFTVKFLTPGDAYIDLITGNGSVSSGIFREQAGRVSNIKIIKASTTTTTNPNLPETDLATTQTLFLGMGLVLIVLTIVLYRMGYLQQFAYILTAGISANTYGNGDKSKVGKKIVKAHNEQLVKNSRENLEKLK